MTNQEEEKNELCVEARARASVLTLRQIFARNYYSFVNENKITFNCANRETKKPKTENNTKTNRM